VDEEEKQEEVPPPLEPIINSRAPIHTSRATTTN